MRRAVLLIATVAACGPALPPLPGRGGPAWAELESEHFTVWTDAGEARGRELVAEMEHLRQVVIGTAFGAAAARPGRGFVIALRDDAEVHEFLPPAFSAMTSVEAGRTVLQPMIVLAARSNQSDSVTVEAHELVHLISHAVIRAQPRWFAEGLARYFETIHIDADAGTVDVGLPPTARGGGPQRQVHMVSLPTALACAQLACMDGSFYVTAWALFTYLTNERRADLARYEERLVATGDGARAWAEVFGPEATEAMGAELRQWLAHGSHTVVHFKVALAAPTVRVRPLGDADVLAVRALLRRRYTRDAAAVVRDVDAALALEPANVLARIVDATLARPHGVAALRATTAAHGDDWRAWWLLAEQLPPGAEATAARGEACAREAAAPALVVPDDLCSR